MIQMSSTQTFGDLAKQRYSFDYDVLKEIVPELPSFDLHHIHKLTNQTGIIQRAKYAIPNYHHGYSLDDNARALILATAAGSIQESFRTKHLVSTYLAFIFYMQKENGKFRNLLSYDNRFLDDEGTEDSYGRTMWSLGFFAKYNCHDEYTLHAQEMFLSALPHCLQLRSVRSVAYSLLGLIDYYDAVPEDRDTLQYIQTLAYYLKEEYLRTADHLWNWFENSITSDNAIIPLSILKASQILHCKELFNIGLKSSAFLDQIYFENGYLSTVGNMGGYTRNGVKAVFGQQPIEVPSTVLLYKYLYQLTGEEVYQQRMLLAFQWFFGKNVIGLKLYDSTTTGCCDGLEQHGVNLNQGAESTLSFWTSYIYMCTRIN